LSPFARPLHRSAPKKTAAVRGDNHDLWTTTHTEAQGYTSGTWALTQSFFSQLFISYGWTFLSVGSTED
jgi:hypothetical protein